jgi:hypothetical protein
MKKSPQLALLIPTLLLAACAADDEGDTAQGNVTLTVYGEDFIEAGIPVSEMSDGWAVEFEKFVVTVRNVQVAGVILATPASVDLAEASNGDGHEIGSLPVRNGDHTDASFSITSVEIEGSAVKDDSIKNFAWSFESPTQYENCETTTTVEEGESATFQITVHADHLFYDSLVSEEPALVFQPLADADADGDGEITQSELESSGIGAFDPGNVDIADLWAWLVAQHRTLGHVDGEGHCEASGAGD